MRKSFYFVVVVSIATLLCLVPAPSLADSVSGETSVAFSASTAASLSGMGLNLSPLGKATFDAATMTLVLPISSGTLNASGDVFKYDGSGFSISNGSGDVTFRNLTINTADRTVSGNMHFGSTQINQIAIFDIGNGGTLTLDAKAAAELSAALGIGNLAGTNVGTASVSIPLPGGSAGSSGSGSLSPTPEPTSLALVVSSLLAAAVLALFRRNRSPQIHHA